MRFLSALLLVGCVATRHPTESESLAIYSLRTEWSLSGRGHPACRPLDTPQIVTLDEQSLQAFCRNDSPGLMGCQMYDPDIGDDSVVIAIREGQSERTHHSLIIHESLHALRTCWVAEDWSRIDHGESEDCQIQNGPDYLHCDREAWGCLAFRAHERWAEWTGNQISLPAAYYEQCGLDPTLGQPGEM